jgi:polysaccharide biosynthesis/export protein
MKCLSIVLASSLLLTGCASGGAKYTLGANSAGTVIKGTELPAPSAADSQAEERPYLVGAFDKLTIDVFGLPELSQKVQADASGRLSVPLVGVVEAAGKTPIEISRMIEDGLRGRFVRNPQVTVNLEETISQVITVDGEVKQSGLYPIIGRMTLMRAVATARGTTEFAKTTEVVVFRTVGGQKMAGLYDLKAIRVGNYADPEIYPNDVIVVGNSPSRRIFKDVIAVSPLFVAPLVAILNGN